MRILHLVSFFSIFVSLAAFAKPPPEAVVYVGKGEMISYQQFMRLNRAQQKIYVKELRTIFVQMTRKSDFFAKNEKSPLVNSLLSSFVPTAEAEADLRCMYGGFVVKESDCRPMSSFGSFSCTDATTALCNPILFGNGSETGDENGTGLCVPRSRNMTAVCAERSSTPQAIDRAVAIARQPESGWDSMSQDFNRLCGDTTGNNPNLRPGLGAKSLRDIGQTCDWARPRFTALAERVAAVPPPPPPAPAPPAGEIVAAGSITAPAAEEQPAPVAVADVPRSLDCKGRCQITVVDVAQRGTGTDFLGPQRGRVSGYRRSTYTSDSCEIKIQSGSGGRVDISNLPANFPDRLMKVRMRNEPCPPALERCTADTARAKGEGYELFARSSGNRRCQLEFVADGPAADGEVSEIADDQLGGRNPQKCMGLDRNATLREDDARYKAYRALTKALARQNCDISKIDVVRPGSEAKWNNAQSATIRDCRLRMSSNVDPNAPVEIRFQPEVGEPYNPRFENLRDDLTDQKLFDRLKARNICFDSWQERLAYRESQRRQPTSRSGESTR